MAKWTKQPKQTNNSLPLVAANKKITSAEFNELTQIINDNFDATVAPIDVVYGRQGEDWVVIAAGGGLTIAEIITGIEAIVDEANKLNYLSLKNRPDLSAYVTLGTSQTVTGLKIFRGTTTVKGTASVQQQSESTPFIVSRTDDVLLTLVQQIGLGAVFCLRDNGTAANTWPSGVSPSGSAGLGKFIVENKIPYFIDSDSVKTSLLGGGGSYTDAEAVAALKKYPTFSSAVNFVDTQFVKHTVVGAIAYTLGTDAHIIGNQRRDYLVADGINKPTFSSAFTVVYDAYNNTAGVKNIVIFEYLDDDEVAVYIQYAS